MRVLTSFPDYQTAVGSDFLLAAESFPPTAFRLEKAEMLRDNDEGQSFSLFFSAPPPLFQQGIFPLEHALLGKLHVFLVPLKQTPNGFYYQAVFNLLKTQEPA